MFNNDIHVCKCVVYPNMDNNHACVKGFNIESSTDGSTYSAINSATATDSVGPQEFIAASNSSAPYWRLSFTNTGYHGGNSFSVRGLQFYGRGNSGVQTLLRAADITDTAYTTIEEVLANSTVLGEVLSSHDAIDYLVTTKVWIDTICANSTAMTFIGQNNYAANTLLADEDWRNGICNSTYIKSVLNVTVPEMISNTEPSGEAFAYNTYFVAWYAFNTSQIYGWLPNAAPSYLTYDFKRPVRILFATVNRLSGGSGAGSSTCVIRAYNDPSDKSTKSATFTKISNSVITTVPLVEPDYYNCYELYISSDSSPAGGYGYKVQFYGREDV